MKEKRNILVIENYFLIKTNQPKKFVKDYKIFHNVDNAHYKIKYVDYS